MTSTPAPSRAPDSPRIWVLTDGKIGDDVQCLAIAAALNPDFEKRVVAPRAPYVWTAPWGPVDPREAPGRDGGPLSGALPDIAVISGRRAIPYARALKRASGWRTKIIMLKDPRAGRDIADALWAPSHDGLTGANVISTLTSPHALGAVLSAPPFAHGAIAALPSPFLGVVLGGPSGGADYSQRAASDLAARISSAGRDYAAIAVTPSRRTPTEFMSVLASSVEHSNLYVWDGQDSNPYRDILSHAAALIVAGDSHNMVSEAMAASAGAYIWRPQGLAAKMVWFTGQLIARGEAKEFGDSAPPFAHTPLDATPEIVAEIRKRLGM